VVPEKTVKGMGDLRAAMAGMADQAPGLKNAIAPLERLGELEFDAETVWQMAMASGASADALGELAVNLGIANDREIALATRQQALIEAFGRGEISASELSSSMAELGRQAAAADAQLRGIKQALDAIPAEKRVTVAVVHETRGSSGGTTETGQTGEFRQHGGDVYAGQAYIVGEKRPELFVPEQDGTILPHVPSNETILPRGPGRASGGGDYHAHIQVNLNAPAFFEDRNAVERLGDTLAQRLQQRGATQGRRRW
jgi:hypothetical protein